uniref:Multidrug and toxin extrusion protein n=1 Tax=Astyanax mexicanus TaxID=7994 RepID=A0A8B9HIY1_ASTMX
RPEEHTAAPSAKLFCCGCVRRYIPLVYREEIYHILRMAGPLLVCRFLNFLLFFVVTMFCGRLGNTELAGYGMASATIHVTATATGYGLTLACDTLVSQTFGSKNLLHVGVILQRGVLILLLFCLPCWALLINTQPLLLLVGQDPEVCFLMFAWFSSNVQAMFLYQLQRSYLQNQGVIMPQMYASVVVNIVNVLANYVLLFWLDLGVHGSAAANSFAPIFSCIALFTYIRIKKLHVKTWGGWSSESLQDWGAYMKLAIPSTLMACFDWWIYEIGGFLAGMLGEVDLAAQHVVIMLAYIVYMIPLGLQGAACVRVGNALGAGNTAGAIHTSKVSLILAAILAILLGVVIASTKTVICVGMGILLGTGQQKIAAIANLLGYYLIGLPLSIILTYPAKLQIAGFWLGLLVAVFLLAIYFVVIIFRLNWKKMTEEVHLVKFCHMIIHTEERSPPVAQERQEVGQEEEKSSAASMLSTSQLMVRRGLTTLAAVLILAVGTVVHLTVPLPEVAFITNNTMDWENFTSPAPLTTQTLSF